MKWYLKVLRQFADFKGRARRKEYWMFVLFNIIFSILAMVVDGLLGTRFNVENIYGDPTLSYYGWVYVLYAVVVLLPSLAVGVRRLHDVGKSGWMMLVALIPIIGSIWLIVLFCTDSEHGPNKWGDDPKSDGTEGLLEPQV
jgi:uncharacterized membrane protein YhaH (DUF805 family)